MILSTKKSVLSVTNNVKIKGDIKDAALTFFLYIIKSNPVIPIKVNYNNLITVYFDDFRITCKDSFTNQDPIWHEFTKEFSRVAKMRNYL